MTAPSEIHLGFEIAHGAAVSVPAFHMAITGQTQNSGKTTTLEALVARSGRTALTFITKRGERSFEDGDRISPYFRDRADWQFVSSIIDATLQEKNKFLRPWIMKICRNTETLADVQRAVRKALVKAKGINEGVYTQLDEYLDLIVPEIARADMAPDLYLQPGKLCVMDLRDYATPMQMLFIQSAIDRVNEKHRETIVVIPEAWEFIPESASSPVKNSAIALARKGAALGNFIWVDSQDMAGVDKTILRACTVWIIGVQREANEIKRNLANIPAGIAKPSAAALATLGRGEFFACWGRHAIPVYVQPAWMGPVTAKAIAERQMTIDDAIKPEPKESAVSPAEAKALREENERLKLDVVKMAQELADLRKLLEQRQGALSTSEAVVTNRPAVSPISDIQVSDLVQRAGQGLALQIDDNAYFMIRDRLVREAPAIIALLKDRPEIQVKVKRQIITIDYEKQPGVLAAMLSEGFFDKPTDAKDVVVELKRRGRAVHNTNVYRDLNRLAEQGFLTVETGGYQAVSGMKVNIVEE